MHSEGSFLLVAVIMVGGILCGYLLRRRKIFSDKGRRIFSLVMLLSTYPVVGLLAVWRMPLQRQFAVLPLIQVLLIILLIGASLAVSYIHRLTKTDRGVFVCACALSNIGFTMGGLVCYVAYGAEGLGLAQIYPMLWHPVGVLVVFPLAYHFSPHSAQRSLGSVVWHGIWHIRSVVMAGVMVGIILSLKEVAYPSWIQEYRVLELTMIIGTFLAYSIIGLSLYLGQIQKYIRLYFSQAAVRFVISPLLALLLVALFGLRISELPGKVVLTMGFMPSAIYTVLIANLFDLNSRLASALFVVNTAVFLVIVLPLLAIFAF